jgi:hypothetical protein
LRIVCECSDKGCNGASIPGDLKLGSAATTAYSNGAYELCILLKLIICLEEFVLRKHLTMLDHALSN